MRDKKIDHFVITCDGNPDAKSCEAKEKVMFADLAGISINEYMWEEKLWVCDGDDDNCPKCAQTWANSMRGGCAS